MDDAQVEHIIREYLPQVIHMTVATCAEGRPWAFEAHYAFDEELNLYWVSEKTARHSQEVAANPQVSGTIVTQHHLNQFVRGLAFEGTAEALEDVDGNHPAFKAYIGRFPAREKAVRAGYEQPDGLRRIYKVNISDWYLIDGMATGKPEKSHLAWGAKI